jgi:hypothetical protein
LCAKLTNGVCSALIDQETGETAAVHEQVRGNGLALLRADRLSRAVRRERGVRDVAALVAHAALDRLALQELAEQYGIKVIAVPDVEWEGLARLRRTAVGGEACGDEEAVRVRRHVGAVDARLDVVHELAHREVVEHGRERVEVLLEPRLGRPALEGDAALIGGVTGGHPLGLP